MDHKDPVSRNSIQAVTSSRFDGSANLPGYPLQSSVKDSILPPLGLSVYPGLNFSL